MTPKKTPKMTSEQLETYRLKAEIEALRVLLVGFLTGLAATSPTAPALIRARFADLRKEHSKIVLRGIDPAYSDMLSSEYQAKLDDLLSQIESKIPK